MAGVTEMRYLHFVLSIFVGRLLRFIILGVLIIAYGPEILSFLASVLRDHRVAAIVVTLAVVLAGVLFVWLRRPRTPEPVETESSVA
jgi:membrane protein DedA with SNARE-associated domain